jgi:nicotinamide riboside kinase
MAGSGKTTLMSALQRSFNTDHNSIPDDDDTHSKRSGYCLNLDPATKLVPYAASIDIRDVVDYKVLGIAFMGIHLVCIGFLSDIFLGNTASDEAT